MSILVDKNTKVLTQGITGSTGQLHTRGCREYGTQMVAGVTPGRGGTDFEGIPIFNTVAQAVQETGANATVIYVPPPFAHAMSFSLGHLVVAKALGLVCLYVPSLTLLFWFDSVLVPTAHG